MFKILIPVNYTAQCLNAIQYAAKLSRSESASIYLLHAYHPIIIREKISDVEDDEKLKESMHIRMNTLVKEVSCSTVCNVSGFAVPGLLADVLTNWCREYNPDLIVIGVESNTKKNYHLYFDVLNRIALNSTVNCLFVPFGFHYKHVRKIAVATDLKDINTVSVAASLRLFSEMEHAKLDIFSVESPEENLKEDKVPVMEMLDDLLTDVRHSIQQIKSNKVVETIINHIEFHRSDWLALIHKSYGRVKQIFHKSVTAEILEKTKIPVLIINKN